MLYEVVLYKKITIGGCIMRAVAVRSVAMSNISFNAANRGHGKRDWLDVGDAAHRLGCPMRTFASP
jgi:hypothetical protein